MPVSGPGRMGGSEETAGRRSPGDEKRGARPRGILIFPNSPMQNDRHTLTFAFVAGRVASLTRPRPCVLLPIVMLRAGAKTLSLGAEQVEKRVTRQAVGGPRALARPAALAAPLTPPRGDFCVIPGTKRAHGTLNTRLCS